MSEPEKKIPVYGFRKFSMELGRHVRSPSKATVEAIESFQAEAIAGTEEWVKIVVFTGSRPSAR